MNFRVKPARERLFLVLDPSLPPLPLSLGRSKDYPKTRRAASQQVGRVVVSSLVLEGDTEAGTQSGQDKKTWARCVFGQRLFE
jgi:hypothetical protein